MTSTQPLPSPSDPEQALAAVVALRAMADKLELAAVQKALEQGWSWSQIAEALGVSKQAAHKRLSGAFPQFQIFIFLFLGASPCLKPSSSVFGT